MFCIVHSSVHLGHTEVVVDQEENLTTCYHFVLLHSVNFLGLKGSLEFGRRDVRQRRGQLGIKSSHIVARFCEHVVGNALGPDLKDPLKDALVAQTPRRFRRSSSCAIVDSWLASAKQ